MYPRPLKVSQERLFSRVFVDRYSVAFSVFSILELSLIVFSAVILILNRPVKIEPRNIFILDGIQQDNILNALRNCYNTFNFEFWLIAADRPVDISVYTSQLELMLNEPLSPARRKMIMQDLEKADMFINNQVVDTEYYVLFKESNMDMLQQKLRAMVNGFAGCSLLATPTTDDDLRIILDNFLNGGVRHDFGTVVVQ